ncbi:ribose transport system substrate-binding protein [Spirochaetota bacterium]|nr:ribose transport system substrate-binding protein [Spirochaetota bacterium]
MKKIKKMKKAISLTIITTIITTVFMWGVVLGEKKTIGLVVPTLSDPFFVALKEGAAAEAKKEDIDLVVFDSENDSVRERANILELIDKKVDVILIDPSDSDEVTEAIHIANDKKIPIITLNRPAMKGEVVTHIASDDFVGGMLVGSLVKKLLNSSGNIAELEGMPKTTATHNRGKGFHQIIDKTDIKVVAREAADFDRGKGRAVMENILRTHDDIAAVFAHNDEMALGAVSAIEAAKRDIAVIGFDAIDEAVVAVKDKKLYATISEQPAEIGKLGVIFASHHLQQKNFSKNIPAPFKIIR